ncbi:MAG: BTAD domain-containing putative transcriptional regulator [Pseudomonadota bacterium]|nr:BTAD domain-containing putative transcriptional regulator [Pseudomonadota bacterium]
MLGAALARAPGGAALTALGAKGMALLAFVALQPGRTATRDVLVDLLWSQGSPDQGRASLRQELRRMKRAMGDLFDAAVETPGGQIALRPGAVITDVEQVETACAARETLGLSALLDSYGGALLAPLAVAEAPFQDWAAARNSNLEALVTDGLLRLMLLDESAGRLDRAAAAARKLLDIDPLQEDVHASLIRIHVAGGRIPQARAQAEACRAVFEAEFGEPPETDLDALIPARRPAPAAAEAPAPAPRRPAGPAPKGKAGAAIPAGAPVARPLAPDPRPRVAIVPYGADAPSRALAEAAADAAIAQFARIGWMRVQGPAALEAAGIGLSDLTRAADYAVTLRAEAGPDASAEIVTAARAGDAAAIAARRLAWPEGGEIGRAAGLGRMLAGALASDLLEAETALALALPRAEAEALRPVPPASSGGDCDCDPAAAWMRLMRARGHVLQGGPAAAEAARALLDPLARSGEADAAELVTLAFSHLEEGWSGWSPAPREALFRGRELALRALRRAPGDPWAQHALGIAAALMEDPAAARAHQLRALSLAPGFAPALGEMARLLALAGDAEEAEAWAARALATAPAAAEAAQWLRVPALARFARGDPAGALEACDRALAARPDWAHSALLRAACLEALGRGAEAREALAPFRSTLTRMAPEAARLVHGFADPALVQAIMAPFADLAVEA